MRAAPALHINYNPGWSHAQEKPKFREHHGRYSPSGQRDEWPEAVTSGFDALTRAPD
jgi:hypothetical protein